MNRCNWVSREETIMKEYYLYKTAKEMMILLPGRNEDQIYSKAKRMGLTTFKKDLETEASNDNSMEIDLSAEAIAKLINGFNVTGLKLIVEPVMRVKTG